MTSSLPAIPKRILDHARQLRRQFHRIPEVMFEEVRTAGLIRDELTRLGIAFTAGVENAPTATIAHFGDPNKPCIALRADIDALPIAEATGVEYASINPGCMHACGHDGHMAALLGATAILKDLDLPVYLKLIFQPAEENGGGAGRLVDAGVIDGRIGPKPRAIFGLHGWPGLPVGTISTKPGPLLAAVDNFIARFHGKGTHAAYPHLGRDPIVAASEAVLALQQIVSREIDPVEPAIITVGTISGGTTFNIIPSSATIEGTIRTLHPETRKYVEKAMRRRLEGIAASHDMRVEFSLQDAYPPTINDAALTDYVIQTVKRDFPPNTFIPAATPSMGGEDFAFYQEKLPGCFILFGLRPAEADSCPNLHHPQFDFNDDALSIAIQLHVALALRSVAITAH